MLFLDDQQRADFLAACGRLTHISTKLAILADKLEVRGVGDAIAELRNAEQVLVSIFQEREAPLGRCEMIIEPGSDGFPDRECGTPAVGSPLGFPVCASCLDGCLKGDVYDETEAAAARACLASAKREDDAAKKPPERDLSEVLGRMLGVIPEDGSDLHARLTLIRDALPYRAPEVEVLSWREVQALLKSYVPELTEPWHHEAAAIFSGRA